MSPFCFCFQSRLRIDKHNKKNPITVATSEDIVFQHILNIPNRHQQKDQQQNLKERIKTIIDQATLRAEKKTSKDRLHITSIKQDAFINVNSFLGGLLLFGLTGRRSENNPPDRMVLELQILSFFIFLGAIMSNLMFLLFVKFHSWKKYQPYQEALVEIKAKVISIWGPQYDAGNDNCNHDNFRNNYDNEAKAMNDGASLSDDWSQYSQYQSLIVNSCTKQQDQHDTGSHECGEEYAEFLTWMRQILDIAAREESNDRERLRKWSIFIPFTLTFIGMVILCLVVFLGANVQLHTGREHERGHLQLWIYIVAPLSLIVPFLTTLYLITYFTGRLHDINS